MTSEPGPAEAPSSAMDAAAALLGELVALGASDVVLSPGSRSQALALVAAHLERLGRIRLHVRIDERVAGFTALGIGRESRHPAIVVCTSGTAVANLLPAVLEAHHAGVPMLLLTADRPPELRGVGANQTTQQPGIFGLATRFAVDAPVPGDHPVEREGEDAGSDAADAAEALASIERDFRSLAREAWAAATGQGTRSPGPVHLNLPVREPLSGPIPAGLIAAPELPIETGAFEAIAELDAAAGAAPAAEASGALYQGGGGIGDSDVPLARDEEPFVLVRGPRTVVVAGADAGPIAEELSWQGGWPLIAEVVSGARFGRYLVHDYRALLREPTLGGAIERVIVCGRPTLSREVTALLSRRDVEVLAVRGAGERVNLNGETAVVDEVQVANGAPDRDWLGAWMSASRAPELAPPAPDLVGLSSSEPAERRAAVDAELAAVRRPLDRAGLVDAVWRASWPHDRLVFGSSRLVRVADEVLPGKNVPVHANRGVAGIDGTLATATGIAIASQAAGRAGVTRLVLGDLALLHDVGAMLLPPGEAEPRLQLIVGNDGGGTIFDGLEVAQTAEAHDFDRVQYTPQRARFEHLALAYGWEYHRVTTRAALDQVLVAPSGGRQLIEVPLER